MGDSVFGEKEQAPLLAGEQLLCLLLVLVLLDKLTLCKIEGLPKIQLCG